MYQALRYVRFRYTALILVTAFVTCTIGICSAAAGKERSAGTSYNGSVAHTASDDSRRLLKALRDRGVGRDLIADIVAVANGDEATIKVGGAWHSIPYRERLNIAQDLWQSWAMIHCPNAQDKAKITIVNDRGIRIGGSGKGPRSRIWVDKGGKR
jgi:hypothetical protein